MWVSCTFTSITFILESCTSISYTVLSLKYNNVRSWGRDVMEQYAATVFILYVYSRIICIYLFPVFIPLLAIHGCHCLVYWRTTNTVLSFDRVCAMVYENDYYCYYCYYYYYYYYYISFSCLFHSFGAYLAIQGMPFCQLKVHWIPTHVCWYAVSGCLFLNFISWRFSVSLDTTSVSYLKCHTNDFNNGDHMRFIRIILCRPI